MNSNFDLAALAIEAVLPNNKVLYDDKGLPSVMVRIPKMSYADLGLGDSTDTFPAFIVNGTEVDEIYISKYQNVVLNGRAYSLPAKDPRTGSFTQVKPLCTGKGTGWHVMTQFEWSLLANWCKQNNCLPKGNNDYGTDYQDKSIGHAIPATFNSEGKVNHVLTGTGPVSWSHDSTLAGIWDLNGNINERMSGIRLFNGELQVIPDNNAADSAISEDDDSTAWRAISAVDGSYITPDGEGTTSNALRLKWDSNHWQWGIDVYTDTTAHNCTFDEITVSEDVSDAAKLKLYALLLLPYDAAATHGGYFSVNVNSERLFYNGGNFTSQARSGLFCIIASNTRSGSNNQTSFRSAYIKLPTT